MKYFLLLSLALLTISCSQRIRVYSDHDPDYVVENFGTFDWGLKTNIEAGKNPLLYNELNDKRIKASVLQELTSRGYKRSDVDPDLIIHYHIIVDDQAIVSTQPYGYNYGPYWTRAHTNVYTYREGTLIIDLMDPKKNNLVWRGWATADLDTITAEETEEMISLAVSKIFKGFPRSQKMSQEPIVYK